MSTDAAAVSDSPRTRKGRELLLELAGVVEHQVALAGVEPDRARAIGEAVLDQVRDQFGGQIVYISKGVSEATRRRWELIWQRFTGTNHDTLASEFGISVPQLYRIVAYMRMEERKRRQGRLFPETEEAQP